MAGDDLQSLIFWQEACCLFTEPDSLETVAYSDVDLQGFDDVVTYYRPGAVTVGDAAVRADCYQVKFNMQGAHGVTAEDLADPAAVRRKERALLDDLVDLRERSYRDDMVYRPTLRSTWYPAPDDALADLWHRLDAHLDIDQLMRAASRSKLGKARRTWMEYLKLWDPEELRPILRHFRISPVSDQVSVLSELNVRLRNAGLRPVDQARLANPYSDLIRKLVQRGHHVFDADGLREVLKRENLVVGNPLRVGEGLTVGIRSFTRRSDQVSELDRCLCLLDLFQRRHIRSPEAWQTQVVPRIEESVRELPYDQSNLTLDLSAAHASIAFYVGYCLDTKAGFRVTVLQRTPNGVEQWGPEAPPGRDAFPRWHVEEDVIGTGSDVVLALSATHDVERDVRTFLRSRSLRVSRLLHCKLPGCPSAAVVASGQHAHMLVSQILERLGERSDSERPGSLHIFAAVPNGLLFFLGQRARGLGRCQLYEYDLESNTPGGYTSSISVPTSSASAS